MKYDVYHSNGSLDGFGGIQAEREASTPYRIEAESEEDARKKFRAMPQTRVYCQSITRVICSE